MNKIKYTLFIGFFIFCHATLALNVKDILDQAPVGSETGQAILIESMDNQLLYLARWRNEFASSKTPAEKSDTSALLYKNGQWQILPLPSTNLTDDLWNRPAALDRGQKCLGLTIKQKWGPGWLNDIRHQVAQTAPNRPSRTQEYLPASLSTVYVEGRSKDETFSGSGFLIKAKGEQYVITSSHVIKSIKQGAYFAAYTSDTQDCPYGSALALVHDFAAPNAFENNSTDGLPSFDVHENIFDRSSREKFAKKSIDLAVLKLRTPLPLPAIDLSSLRPQFTLMAPVRTHMHGFRSGLSNFHMAYIKDQEQSGRCYRSMQLENFGEDNGEPQWFVASTELGSQITDPGLSGSPLFDDLGQVLCIATGYMNRGHRYASYCEPLTASIVQKISAVIAKSNDTKLTYSAQNIIDEGPRIIRLFNRYFIEEGLSYQGSLPNLLAQWQSLVINRAEKLSDNLLEGTKTDQQSRPPWPLFKDVVASLTDEKARELAQAVRDQVDKMFDLNLVSSYSFRTSSEAWNIIMQNYPTAYGPLSERFGLMAATIIDRYKPNNPAHPQYLDLMKALTDKGERQEFDKLYNDYLSEKKLSFYGDRQSIWSLSLDDGHIELTDLNGYLLKKSPTIGTKLTLVLLPNSVN